MKTFKTIEEALNFLYNENGMSYSAFVKLPENIDKSSLFVAYIKLQFERFKEVVKAIDEPSLIKEIELFGDFEGHISKRRFTNLIQKISEGFLNVLHKCYYPNQAQALIDLEKLLGMNNRILMPYLVEQLINYCSFDYPRNSILYRVRDAKNGDDVDNCWHTPFNIRQRSYAGRFSSPGFPCLYLADSIKTCCAEVGPLNEGQTRWLGEFHLKEGQLLGCLDLTIPSNKRIKASNSYERIQFFLTYPIRILCTTFAEHKSDTFGEEYLFSQALINLLSSPANENSGMCRVSGIIYDSTRNNGGINIAIPAKSDTIPPRAEEKYSRFLQAKFHHNKPSIIDTHEPAKK